MINPTDFHKTAEFLKDKQEEWHVRTTVNRSYYGVFLYFRDFLNCQGVILPDPFKTSHHQFVIKCFEKSKTTAIKANDKIDHKILGTIWMRLKTLLENRIKADYNLGLRFPPSYSNDSLKRAKTTIQDFIDLSGTPTETLIVDVAKSYGNQIMKNKVK